jgi:uncharacterized MAPEG superfamily protein
MTAYNTELQILFCAIALGLVQLALATMASVSGRGMPWGIGPRDEGWPPLGKVGGRLERAYKNFLETFPLFAAAVLLVYALSRSSSASVLGAEIYIWARVLYVPAYVLAIPFTRTLLWTASIVGIVLVWYAAWP